MKRAATTTPVPVPAPVDGQKTLSSYITARFDEFSRSQKDVAQYIVDHLDDCLLYTSDAADEL